MTELKGYHAHVYYDTVTRPTAERLREAIIGQFTVRPGAFNDEPIGPHPISQFSVIFETGELNEPACARGE
jgi:aromatic ring-cleaving dioxygenase